MKSEFYIGGVSVIEFDEALLNARGLSELNLLLLFNGLCESLKEAGEAIKASQLIKSELNLLLLFDRLFDRLFESLKEAQGAVKASQLIKKADNGGINL